DALTRRREIEKPQEEFLLPPPRAIELDPAPAPDGAAPATLPTLIEELYEEAGRVQELHDLVIQSAEPVEVTVPSDEPSLLGDRITTQQYLESLRDGGSLA